jgi:hypothetical protein
MMTIAKKLGFPDGTIMKAIRAYSTDAESQLKIELVRKANFEQVFKERFGEELPLSQQDTFKYLAMHTMDKDMLNAIFQI